MICTLVAGQCAALPPPQQPLQQARRSPASGPAQRPAWPRQRHALRLPPSYSLRPAFPLPCWLARQALCCPSRARCAWLLQAGSAAAAAAAPLQAQSSTRAVFSHVAHAIAQNKLPSKVLDQGKAVHRNQRALTCAPGGAIMVCRKAVLEANGCATVLATIGIDAGQPLAAACAGALGLRVHPRIVLRVAGLHAPDHALRVCC